MLMLCRQLPSTSPNWQNKHFVAAQATYGIVKAQKSVIVHVQNAELSLNELW